MPLNYVLNTAIIITFTIIRAQIIFDKFNCIPQGWCTTHTQDQKQFCFDSTPPIWYESWELMVLIPIQVFFWDYHFAVIFCIEKEPCIPCIPHSLACQSDVTHCWHATNNQGCDDKVVMLYTRWMVKPKCWKLIHSFEIPCPHRFWNYWFLSVYAGEIVLLTNCLSNSQDN